MFFGIKRMINTLRVYRHVATNLTPEQKARFDAATTDEEKGEVAIEIVKEMYPEILV